MVDRFMGNVVTLITDPQAAADERSEQLLADYRAQAKRHLSGSTPESFAAAHQTYAAWVRDYLGGAEAEHLIQDFGLGQGMKSHVGKGA